MLVPKKLGAKDLKDFKSISFVGSLYKWITKVLANRLKTVMGDIMNLAQDAFVEGGIDFGCFFICKQNCGFHLEEEQKCYPLCSGYRKGVR